MALLSTQLKYFIAKKVTEDSSWRGCQIVLSGHETPGEGEHKIMEYIRLSRSQADYNPNTRHCMYGLDADLIMLGLLTHDPHFCLLREEVSFGPKKSKGSSKSLDSTNFFLLHLSLLREYLDEEFDDLKKKINANSNDSSNSSAGSSSDRNGDGKGTISKDISTSSPESTFGFQYDLEKVIDDFILLNIFVGNDFLPHLPGLHINEGALPLLFSIYKKILPQAGGYINEAGRLNTKRLELVIRELAEFETNQFINENADLVWYRDKEFENKGKDKNKNKNKNRERERDELKRKEIAKLKFEPVLTPDQKEYFEMIRKFILDQRTTRFDKPKVCCLPPKSLESKDGDARDLDFLKNLARELNLRIDLDEYDPDNDCMTIAFSVDIHAGLGGALNSNKNKNMNSGLGNDMVDEDLKDDDDEEDEESNKAIDRVLMKYQKAKVVDHRSTTNMTTAADTTQVGNGLENQVTEVPVESEFDEKLRQKMTEWKREYYASKLEISYSDSNSMSKLAFRYIEGLQWVLHYYYDGVVSWGWFYDYHYSPKISDLKNVSAMKFEFNLGSPFRPFEQLMGVLPALSSKHIPEAFRSLMLDPESPLKDFYPENFEADLNGKKQDWEAVVKIPFIDEKRLLDALKRRENFLTRDEKDRNSFGMSTKFSYDQDAEYFLESSLKGEFPDLVHSKAKIETFNLPTLDVGKSFVKGLSHGVKLGRNALAGFPSLKTLNYTSMIQRHGVNVFQAESRGDSVVLHIQNELNSSLNATKTGIAKPEEIARNVVGKKTFVNWPFLFEGFVTALSDGLFRYQLGWVNNRQKIISEPMKPSLAANFGRKTQAIERHYSKRFGVVIGSVDYLLHVRPLKGLTRLEDGSLVKEYEDREEKELEYPLQLLIEQVENQDQRFIEKPPTDLSTEFPDRTQVFFLGKHLFGSPGVILSDTTTNTNPNLNNTTTTTTTNTAEADKSNESLNVKLTVFNQHSRELIKLKNLIDNCRFTSDVYYPSFQVSKLCGISGLALSRLTSSMLIEDGSPGISRDSGHGSKKVNIGLNLKFENKGLKVLGYTRKGMNGAWEFSQKAVDLLKEYKQLFPEVFQTFLDNPHPDLSKDVQFFGSDTDFRMPALRKWIKEKGVRDFEAVSLFADQFDKSTISTIEEFLTKSAKSKVLSTSNQDASKNRIRKMLIKGLPRNAVLKPEHSIFKLQNQSFNLGDKVLKVSEVGSVPICANGVIVGKFSNEDVEVVFDLPFIGGHDLGGRCSEHRGAVVSNWMLLNLTNPQFISEASSTNGSGTTTNTATSAVNAYHSNVSNSSGAMRSPRGPPNVQNRGFTTRSTPETNHTQQAHQVYRPPNHFKPNPHTQSSSKHPGGIQILDRNGSDTIDGSGTGSAIRSNGFAANGTRKEKSKPQVSEQFKFANVLGGKEKPSENREKDAAEDLNPHLAALNLGGGSNGASSSKSANQNNRQDLNGRGFMANHGQSAPPVHQHHQQGQNLNWQQQQQQQQFATTQFRQGSYRQLDPSAGNQLLHQLQRGGLNSASLNKNSVAQVHTQQSSLVETSDDGTGIVQREESTTQVKIPTGPSSHSNANARVNGKGNGGGPASEGSAPITGPKTTSFSRGRGFGTPRGRGVNRGGRGRQRRQIQWSRICTSTLRRRSDKFPNEANDASSRRCEFRRGGAELCLAR